MIKSLFSRWDAYVELEERRILREHGSGVRDSIVVAGMYD
jgi:hypothetical protein